MADDKAQAQQQQKTEAQPRQQTGSQRTGDVAGLPDQLREALEASMPGHPHGGPPGQTGDNPGQSGGNPGQSGGQPPGQQDRPQPKR